MVVHVELNVFSGRMAQLLKHFLFIIWLLRPFYSVNTSNSFYVKHFVVIHFQGIVSYEWSKTPSSPAVGDMQVSTTGLTGLTRGISWEFGNYR